MGHLQYKLVDSRTCWKIPDAVFPFKVGIRSYATTIDVWVWLYVKLYPLPCKLFKRVI